MERVRINTEEGRRKIKPWVSEKVIRLHNINLVHENAYTTFKLM